MLNLCWKASNIEGFLVSLFQGFAIFIISWIVSPAIQLEFSSLWCKPVHHEHGKLTFLHGGLYIFEGCCPTYPFFFKLSNASSFTLYSQIIFLDNPCFLFLFFWLFAENTYFRVISYLRVCKEWWWVEHWLLLFPFSSERPDTETEGWYRLLWNVKLARSLEKQIHCVWPYYSIWSELQHPHSPNLVLKHWHLF